jgi:segregation and condensation protein A
MIQFKDDMMAPPPADGIEILVSMAKTGQIDPWNVDIVAVADQYLKAVAELRESDLKITGKTVLYLAILLRMKSDMLAGRDYLDPPPEFEPEPFDEDLLEEPKARRNNVLQFRSLDEAIRRRTSVKQPRIRPVTLNDLIAELKKYEDLEKRRSLRERVERSDNRRVADFSHFTSDDIEELAHEEFHEDVILQLREVLERILIHQEQVSLTELTEAGGVDKVTAFLALLFLSARGAVDLHQESFYSELYATAEAPAEMMQPDSLLDDPGAILENTVEIAG